MNVKKIIVDELPEKCRDCQFWCEHSVDMEFSCLAKDKTFTNLKIRQSWCPLVVEDDEVCEWKGIDVEILPYKKDIRYTSPHSIKAEINYFQPKEFKYCFVCGKRIKYVESEE